MHVAIIGCGEVGRCYGAALADAGHCLSVCEPAPSAPATALVQRLGATLHAQIGPWLGEAQLVLSCVVGAASLEVALAALPHMAPAAVFADLTTADPADIRRAAIAAQRLGIGYADVAIMGAISLAGVKTPLLCAGVATEMVKTVLGSLGAPLRLLGSGSAGDAAALKILRSVFMKGLEALAIESFTAAKRLGKIDQLHEALSDMNDTPLRDFLEALIRTHVVHAPRRLHEIEAAERELCEAGLDVLVLPGVRKLFERSCEAMKIAPIADARPTADAALTWLLGIAAAEPGN
jgi:3-hydroxyisobutyrate dehydrogenase